MNLSTTKFFNSSDVHVSSRMNEYLKKNFGYEVEGDLDTLEEAKKSLEAEQVELKKESYMNQKYMENMLMIETINSLLKAHGKVERIDELLPALAVGALAAKVVGGLVGAGAKAVAGSVGNSVNASKKAKGKKKLNAVKEDDDYMLKRSDGEYDKEEIRKMQYQQNVADPLNRDIEASEKATTIEVDYDLELDTPKSQNHLLKKHYKEMRKFNVFISMPEWQEGPKDSGFGQWTAKVRGSKKNLLGWLKAWEFDYDKEQLADMGLVESVSIKEDANDDMRDIAMRCVDEMVKNGIIPDCTDTDCDTEWQVQDIIHDQLNKSLRNKTTSQGQEIDEATHSEAKAIYDLVGSLGAGEIELAQNPIFHDLIRYLDSDTINKFVADFRKKMDDKDFKGSVDFGQYEAVNEDDEEEKGPDHYRWKNDSQLSQAERLLAVCIEKLDDAITYRAENSHLFFNNGDKAGTGDLYSMKDKLEELHNSWDEQTEYYGM